MTDSLNNIKKEINVEVYCQTQGLDSFQDENIKNILNKISKKNKIIFLIS